METAQSFKDQGNKEFGAKNYDKAIELYTKAIELDKSQAVFYSNRSACYLSINQFEKALEDAEECVKVNPQYIKGYLRKGLALFKMDKKEDSLKTYEEGLNIDPLNAQLLKDKETVETSMRPQMDPSKLMELMNNPMIKEMMSKNPQLAQMMMQNPQMLQNPQMMQMMMNMFKQQSQKPGQDQTGDEMNPNKQFNPQQQQQDQHSHEHGDCKGHDHGQDHSGQQKEQQKPKQEEKKQDLNEFSNTKKEADQCYFKKDFDKAIELYDKCIGLDSSNLVPMMNKATCYIEKNDLESAMKVIDEAHKVYKDTDTSKRNLTDLAKVLAKKARIYHLQKDLDNSIHWYKQSLLQDKIGKISASLRAVEREKKKIEASNYLNPEKAEEHRQKGNEQFKKGDFAKALEEYEEGVKRNPKEAKLYNNMAACLIKMMKFSDALKYVEQTLELDPLNIKALNRKALIYNFQKEYHKAMECFNSVLKIDPENKDAQQGIVNTRMKIGQSMGDKPDEERIQRAMQDPEIQSIMMDPMVKIALGHMQKNPKNIMEYMQDPTLGPKLQKLIQSGILRMGQLIQ